MVQKALCSLQKNKATFEVCFLASSSNQNKCITLFLQSHTLHINCHKSDVPGKLSRSRQGRQGAGGGCLLLSIITLQAVKLQGSSEVKMVY